MNSQPELKQKHNQRIAQYRARSDKERLELVVSPELANKFRQLPGLFDKTNAQKLEALCDLWLKQQPDQEFEPVQALALGAVAAEPDQKVDTGNKISKALSLEQIVQELDAVDQELAEEDVRDSASGSELQQVPEMRAELAKEVSFYRRSLEGYSRSHSFVQKSRIAMTWARVLREEPLIEAAMAQVSELSPELAELITSGKALNYVTPRDVAALTGLSEDDRIQLLKCFMRYGCSDQVEAQLGELGLRFRQAWQLQPERTPQSWKLKPVPRQRKVSSSAPTDDAEYKREMLNTIENLYEQLYPKDGKPGNTAAARARKNIPVIVNLRMGPYHKLYQLLVADLLPVSESELRTLSQLSPEEQRLALWTLVQGRTEMVPSS